VRLRAVDDGGLKGTPWSVSHKDPVAFFSPDGKRIFLADQTSEAVGSLRRGQLVDLSDNPPKPRDVLLPPAPVDPSPPTPGAPFLAGRFRADGKAVWLATDREAWWWDVDEGRPARPALHFPARASAAALGVDGVSDLAATDRDVRLWAAGADGALAGSAFVVRPPEPFESEPFESAVFSSDATALADVEGWDASRNGWLVRARDAVSGRPLGEPAVLPKSPGWLLAPDTTTFRTFRFNEATFKPPPDGSGAAAAPEAEVTRWAATSGTRQGAWSSAAPAPRYWDPRAPGYSTSPGRRSTGTALGQPGPFGRLKTRASPCACLTWPGAGRWARRWPVRRTC
jgi:hypothetical protein